MGFRYFVTVSGVFGAQTIRKSAYFQPLVIRKSVKWTRPLGSGFRAFEEHEGSTGVFEARCAEGGRRQTSDDGLYSGRLRTRRSPTNQPRSPGVLEHRTRGLLTAQQARQEGARHLMIEEESLVIHLEIVEVVQGSVAVEQVQFVRQEEKLRKR